MDADPDTLIPLRAFSAGQAASRPPRVREWLRWQHVTAPPGMLLAGFGLLAGSAHFVRIGRERAGGVSLLALHWLLLPAWLVWLLRPDSALLWLVIQQAVFGCYVATVNAINHAGMPEASEVPDDFLRQQVLTGRNVSGGPVMDFLCGGLNLHIEHHLFPTMPRNRLRAARQLVRPFCDARGVSYHETTFAGALRESYGSLVAVARSVSVAGA